MRVVYNRQRKTENKETFIFQIVKNIAGNF